MSDDLPTMLHYDADPASSKPTLLLIHAMGADLSFWQECRAIWSGQYRCVAVDLRGSGRSPAATKPLTIQDHVADLEHLVARLDLGPLIPVGCAIGGTVAAAYAAHNLAQCQALVLSNPSIGTSVAARAALAKRSKLVRAGGMAACIPSAVDGAFRGDGSSRRRAAYTALFVAQDPASYANVVDGILDADIRTIATTITCPTLIVSGDNDVLLPAADHAVALGAAIEVSELVMLPGAAHFIPYQRPAAFAGLVADFTDRLGVLAPMSTMVSLGGL